MADPAPRPASLTAGYDESDPYEGEDLSDHPDWWRYNIELFRAHGLRPYRPPRFADSTFVPEETNRLEADLNVDIHFQVFNPQQEAEWKLVVDGEAITPVPRSRMAEGYTRYELTADEFEELVRSAATDS
jgi:hypothetical protein